MKVKELMEMLAKLDPDMEIRFRDTYWENEGYGSQADDPRELTHYTTGAVICDMQDGTEAVVIR